MANAVSDGRAATVFGAQPGVSVDPYRAYNFKLVIHGVVEGHFAECSGMEVSVETIAYREGGVGQVVNKVPGRVEYGDVTLRYGLTNSRELWDWFLSAVEGKVSRRNVSIVLLDNDGITEVMRWNLNRAWPNRWRGAALNALGHEVAIESITLAFEWLERA